MIGVDLLHCILQTITQRKAKDIVKDRKTTLSHLYSCVLAVFTQLYGALRH